MGKGAGKKNGSRDDRATVDTATPLTVTTGVAAAPEVTTATDAPRPAPPAPQPVVRSGRTPAERVSSPSSSGVVEWAGEVGAASLRSVQAVLPTARTPVVLLGAGLLIAGVVELPVVVGAGLVYEALRQWQPRAPRADR